MTRWSLTLVGAAGLSLVVGAAGAQDLGSSPEATGAAPAMPSAAPAMPGAAPAMPGAMASPAAPMPAAPPSLTVSPGAGGAGGGTSAAGGGASPTPGGGATAGIVGLRGAMIARKGTVYETLDTGVNTQAFMTIENQSSSPDSLTSVDCTIADSTAIVGGDGKPLTSVPVNPGKPLVLAANGIHVVLTDVRYNILDQTTVPCSLNFKYAGAIQAFLFAIPKPGGGAP